MQAAVIRSWFIMETSPAPTSSPPAADSCMPSLASHLALVGLSWVTSETLFNAAGNLRGNQEIILGGMCFSFPGQSKSWSWMPP